jgi:hypothetical protein
MKCQIKNREKVIDDYIMGVIAKGKKELFEEHYFNCDVCFHELQLKEEAVSIIKDEGQSIFAKYLRSKTNKESQSAHINIFKLPQIFPERLPALIFASVLTVITLLGSYYVINRINSLPQYQFNFDNKLPHDYAQSSLRGDSENKYNVLFNIFNNQYLAGISDYINHNYSSAITSWNKVESIASDLENTTTDRKLLLAVRNYYFYLGVSHLAISVSQKNRISAHVRRTHNDVAIHYLSKADSLSNQNQFINNDRETYYIGMALGIGGKKEKALEKLTELTTKSIFHEEANELIKKWASE